jgi:murein DD-endopeptidase MepM/ murein hydrolase activator NlpD
VTIRTTEGVLISMEPVAALVTEGDHVSQGQRIATLEPGHCAEPCLHLGLREGGEYRSARRELGVLQRSVLLPLGDYARG